MKICLLCFSLLTLLLTSASSMAEMVLEEPTIEVKPRPEDEIATIEFAFHNRGKKPVRILNIDSGCSCLEATLDKEVYQPGEKGLGKAEFTVSTFVGRHEKSILITTDAPDQPRWVLPFVIDIPAVIQIEPKNLQWVLGEPAEPKTCSIKMVGPDPLNIVKISSTREQVEYQLREIKPGREYEISIKPTNTSDVMLGALKIETDSKILKYQRQLAFFSVFRKPASTSSDSASEKP